MRLSINIKDTFLDLSSPKVMGILNVTTDSFFDGGQFNAKDKAIERVAVMLEEGADIIDVGGYSSRPGANEVSVAEELDRVVEVTEELSKRFDTILSIDTFRAEVAREAVRAGAHIVNDISAGDDDPEMLSTVAALSVPYIFMHKQGTSKTMQRDPRYDDVVTEVFEYLSNKKAELQGHGIEQIIADPGFGFGKTVEHNYQLLNDLEVFKTLDIPILAGISRKSMINKVLGVKAKDALNGTTFLHAFCLQGGASILRVHDVLQAKQAVMLWEACVQYR